MQPLPCRAYMITRKDPWLPLKRQENPVLFSLPSAPIREHVEGCTKLVCWGSRCNMRRQADLHSSPWSWWHWLLASAAQGVTAQLFIHGFCPLPGMRTDPLCRSKTCLAVLFPFLFLFVLLLHKTYQKFIFKTKEKNNLFTLKDDFDH